MFSPFLSETRRRGAALLMVLILVATLSIVAANLLLTASTRYHTTFQSASWQEAIVGAEAGVDIGMNELRTRVVQGPSAAFQHNWTTLAPSGSPYANYGHAFPANNLPCLLSTSPGEGNTSLQSRVYIDVPGSSSAPSTNFAQAPPDANSSFLSMSDNPALRDPDGVDRSRWWYRIRALGIAGLAGAPVSNLEKLDNELRRFSFFSDWRTGLAVPNPQVARMVEVLVAPQTNFRNALMADKQIDLSSQDVLVDSYDSSQGPYSNPGNVGTMGNIATNGQLINAGNADVQGDAMTDNGTVTGAAHVTGQQSSNFYQELLPITPSMLNPAWSSVPDGGVLTTSTSYTASPDPNMPTLVRLDGINLPDGGFTVNINAATATSTSPSGAVTTNTIPSYIKLYVQGDIRTAGSSYITMDPNVSMIVYFGGNMNLQGPGIINNSFRASHLVLDGLQPPANADGTFPPLSLNIATTEDFQGVVYAPNHDLNLTLNAVPPASTGGLLGSVLSAVTNARTQLSSTQAQLAGVQADYQQALAIQQKTGAPGQSTKVTADLASIANLQAQINQLNATMQSLAGAASPSSATDHALGYNGIYGGFVARTITVADKTHVHYDETLRTAGPVNHYQIVTWFEDNLSRDSGGGAEVFWWPPTGTR